MTIIAGNIEENLCTYTVSLHEHLLYKYVVLIVKEKKNFQIFPSIYHLLAQYLV